MASTSTELVALEEERNGVEMVLLAMLPLEDQVMMVQTPARRSIGELEVFIKDEYQRVFPKKAALPADVRIQKCVTMDKVLNRKQPQQHYHHHHHNNHHAAREGKQSRHCFVELAKNVRVGNVFENMEQIYVVTDASNKAAQHQQQVSKKNKNGHHADQPQPATPKQQQQPTSKNADTPTVIAKPKSTTSSEEVQPLAEKPKEKNEKESAESGVKTTKVPKAAKEVKSAAAKAAESEESAPVAEKAARKSKKNVAVENSEAPSLKRAKVAVGENPVTLTKKTKKAVAAAAKETPTTQVHITGSSSDDQNPADESAVTTVVAAKAPKATPKPTEAETEVTVASAKKNEKESAESSVKTTKVPKAAKVVKSAAAKAAESEESAPVAEKAARKSKKNVADESAEAPPLKRAKVAADDKPARLTTKAKETAAAITTSAAAPIVEKPAKVTTKAKKEAAAAAAAAASAAVAEAVAAASEEKTKAAAAGATAAIAAIPAVAAVTEKPAKVTTKAKKEAAAAAAVVAKVVSVDDTGSSTDEQVPVPKRPVGRPKSTASSKQDSSSQESLNPVKAKPVRLSFSETLAVARERIKADKLKAGALAAAVTTPEPASAVSESTDESDFEDVQPVVAKKSAPVKTATAASPKPKVLSKPAAPVTKAASTTASDDSSSDEELDFSQRLLADLTGNTPTTPPTKPRVTKKASKLALRVSADKKKAPKSSQDEPVTDLSQEYLPELTQKSPTHESNSVLLSSLSKSRFSLGNIPVAKLKKSAKNPFAAGSSQDAPVQPKKRGRPPKVKP